ncbi:hypothetical protein C4K02_3885 [Pseudomonas synxantha]|nr:hypothetical protein C4K02_3885 [Pseudomonas synxantha]
MVDPEWNNLKLIKMIDRVEYPLKMRVKSFTRTIAESQLKSPFVLI